MRFRKSLAGAACVAILTACGGSAEPPHHLSVVVPKDDHALQLASRAEHEQLARFYDVLVVRARADWFAAVQKNAERDEEQHPASRTLARSVPVPSAPSCTTNTPLPADVIAGESGGKCDAYNPTGCGGRGCIGYAQLDAGHFYAVSPWNPNVPGTCYGLSYDACVDRLWAGGSGKAHWGR